MKIAFFEIKEWEKEYINSRLKGHEVSFFAETLNEQTVSSALDFPVISPFIYSRINREVLSELPALKMIATRSTGFDHIDASAAAENKIAVCNVPFYGENTVAEHAFALILCLSRKIIDSVESTRKGEFSAEGFTGFDLKGKTIGIVGMGHIGQHVARIAKGFEMEILASDAFQNNELAGRLGFKYAALEELLKKSDIITLHLPYSKSTHHLINSENIGLIKRGAFLINTARGGLIESAALFKGLSEGILAGAGLDVLEEEGFIKEEAQLLSKEFFKDYDLKTVLQNHILLRQKNVLITPHNAFNSKEALQRILDTTIENIEAFSKSQPLNLVEALKL